MILQWLASPEWAQVVKALLHTLWQAAFVAAVLGLALRLLANPSARYRCSLAALATVLLAALVSWAVLNRTANTGAPLPASAPRSVSTPVEVGSPGEPSVVVVATSPRPEQKPVPPRWTAWLALVWLAGAGLMLARAGAQVAGADRLRRSCRPLADERISELVAEARRAIGLARRLRVVATDKLTSPAVVGVLVPTLILPLSLITALTPEQIRFVLLHELAHIRRGDYLANLFQLLAEALLFFNPAVWWISHQVRREREACCDTLAIELSGAPADYARTLVQVAESVLNPPPAAAPAFGDKPSKPSSLADRVQRLLVPGYRPALRLTWRAMLTALLLGCVLLGLSAVGTRVTVAAAARLLSPEQRIERIEQKMTEYGQKPEALDSEAGQSAPKTEILGRVRMADGSPVQGEHHVTAMESTRSGSGFYGVRLAADGSFHYSARRGKLWLVFGDDGDCAPAALGPIDTTATNRIGNLDLVADRGFNVTVEVVDADTGAPVSGAKLATRFWVRGANSTNFRKRDWTTDGNGRVLLDHCADLPLGVTLNASDYVIVEEKFDSLKAGQTLRIAARRGVPLAGVVMDKITGRPVSGATLHLLLEDGPAGKTAIGGHEVWDDPQRLMGTTDAEGRFVVRRLRSDTRYAIGVKAAARESVILDGVFAGQSNQFVRLGPELVVQCRFTGNLDLMKKHAHDDQRYVQVILDNSMGGSRTSFGEIFDVTVRDGVGHLRFTNWVAGPVIIEAAGRRFERDVDAPLDDWVIDLGQAERVREPMARREVVLHFKHSSGVLPRGTIHVSLTEDSDSGGEPASRKECEIQNGEVRVTALVGTYVSWEPARTVGYWFKEDSLQAVPPGVDPLVITLPAVPAGAIYAKARNADGTPAANLSFSVIELRRSPLRAENDFLSTSGDSFSHDDVPRKWVSSPLPLGGTYRIVGSRGNSFCASEPVTLTEEKPDAELELQFPAGRAIEGRLLDAAGQPVRHVELTGSFSITNHGFGLKAAFTDADGRFRFEDATPGIGKYTLNVQSPGCRAETIPVDFARLPLTVRLKPGLKLAGQVIETGTGHVIPNAELRAWTYDPEHNWPQQTTRTDAEGRFEFNTLADATYTICVAGANYADTRREQKFKAGQTAPLKLVVTPYPGSRFVPKPQTGASNDTSMPPSGARLHSEVLAKAQADVDQAQATVDRLRTELHVFDPDPMSLAPAPTLSVEALRTLRSTLLTLEFEQVRLETQLKALKELDPPALREAIQTAAGPDSELDGLLSDYSVAQQKLLGLEKSMTVESAEYKSAKKVADTLNTKINNRVEGIMVGLDMRVEVGRKTIEELKTRVEKAKQIDLETAVKTRPYYEAKQRLVDLQAFYRILEKKLAQQQPDFPNAGTTSPSPGGEGRGLSRQSPAKPDEDERQLSTNPVQAAAAAPPQINIRVKYVEVPEPFITGLGATNGLAGNATTQSLTGILTAPQFKTFFSLLEQQHDVHVVAEGQVTTLSGRQAQIQILDPYPSLIATNINPQALKPPGVRSGDTNGLYQMDRLPLGPVFDVTPTVGPDGATVDMQMIVSVIEFLGFEPATNSVEAYVDGRKQTVSLPLPQLNQHQTTSKAIVWDGQTVVLGGAPIAALASSEKTGSRQEGSSKRKQLLVFVTPTIIDPAGNRIHSEGELPAARKGVPPQSSSFAPAAEGAGIFPGQAPSNRTTSRRAPNPLRPVPEIMAKLNQIRLDSVFYDGLPLGEVLRNLSEELKKRDPDKRGINFLIQPDHVTASAAATIDTATGQPVTPNPAQTGESGIASATITISPPLQNVRLGELLCAIVESADRPLKFTIKDYGILFSAKVTNEPPTFYVRKFRVDPIRFMGALEKVSGTNRNLHSPGTAPPVDVTSAPTMPVEGFPPLASNQLDPNYSAVIAYFESLGVDLRPETGKNVFFNPADGTLLVRATEQDLDIIEDALDALSTPSPQVHIKGTFVTVSREGFAQFLDDIGMNIIPSVSSTQQFTGVLTAAQSRTALSALERRKDAKVLFEGQIITLSERQGQIQAVDLQPVVSVGANGLPQTNQWPLGPVLDVLPTVESSMDAVQLTVAPSVTEFLGYDDPGQFRIEGQNGSPRTIEPQPHFRVRQMSLSTNVPDGQTLVLGGSAATEVTLQKTKVPVLGSLPLLGQLFRGGRVVTQTNYLVVFVTPTLIDPAGNRIHPGD